MHIKKISIPAILSIIIYLLLLIFVVVTCLLGFYNQPRYAFSIFFAVVLATYFALLPKTEVGASFNPFKDYKALALLILMTLTPRIIWIYSIHTVPQSDFAFYQRIASLLMNGRVDSQTWIGLFPNLIGYPTVLSIVYRIFGSSYLSAQFFNIFLFLGIVLGIFILAAKLFNRKYAVLVAAIVALWPSQIFFTTLISTEALYTFLLIGSLCLFYYSQHIDRLPQGLLPFTIIGIAIGAINAIRPNGLLLLFAVFIYYFFILAAKSPGIKPWITRAVLYSCLFLGYLAASSFIHFTIQKFLQVDVAKNSLGYFILVGSNYESGGVWNEHDAYMLFRVYDYGKTDPDEVNRILLEKAINRIKASPKYFLLLQLRKNQYIWQDDTYGIYWSQASPDGSNPTLFSNEFLNALMPVSNYYYYAVLLLCSLGCVFAIKNLERNFISLIVLIVLGSVIVFVFAEVQSRYHYYVLPLFALIAGYGLYWLNQAVNHRFILDPIVLKEQNSD